MVSLRAGAYKQKKIKEDRTRFTIIIKWNKRKYILEKFIYLHRASFIYLANQFYMTIYFLFDIYVFLFCICYTIFSNNCYFFVQTYINILRMSIIDEYNTYLTYFFTNFTNFFLFSPFLLRCHTYVHINTSVKYIRQTHASNFFFAYTCVHNFLLISKVYVLCSL